MSTGAWLILMLGAGFLGGMVALIADTQYIFRKNGVWDRAYESGVAPTGPALLSRPVPFCLLAMFFLVFDVETIFLYPWAVIVDELAWFGFLEMVVFLFILVVGYFWAWREGALEWA